MLKKTIGCVTLIIYPVAIFTYVFFYSLLMEQVKRANVHFAYFIALICIYFCLLAVFVFAFFVRRMHFRPIFLAVGFTMLILFQTPPFLSTISPELHSLVYNHFLTVLFLFNTFSTLYVLLFFTRNIQPIQNENNN